MASVFHLYNEALQIKQKIVKKYTECLTNDKNLYFSALAIQRRWRGYTVRKMIKNYNRQATLIQKNVRGWLTRLHLPEAYAEHYFRLGANYYNQKATIIQSFWRGYCARRAVEVLRQLAAERAALELASRQMQEMLKEAFDELRPSRKKQMKQDMENSLKILFNRHHLLRTVLREGIFSKHRSNELSCIEKILKSFRLTEYMKELRHLQHPPEDNVIQTEGRKRYDLYSRPTPKPYERMLLSQNEYERGCNQ